MNKYLTKKKKCSQTQEKIFKDVHSHNLRAERFTDREEKRPRGASNPGQGFQGAGGQKDGGAGGSRLNWKTSELGRLWYRGVNTGSSQAMDPWL